MLVQGALELVHAQAIVGRDLQQRIVQFAVDAQQVVQRRAVVLVDQVGLVEQQQRLDAGVLGGHQVAVDEVGVGRGQRGEDDHQAVDVGRHRLEQAAHVRPADFRAARQLGDDDAIALEAGAKHHPVAGDQGRQVGAQVTALQLAFVILDLHLNAEVGDHQALLLRSQIAAFEFVDQLGFALFRAGGAFGLDFLDPPALATGQVAFGHGMSAGFRTAESSIGRPSRIT